MYPWKESLSSWVKQTGLRVDALGIVTILGAEEISNSVGRLVRGRYVEYLPLLGAFMIAGNRFTEKAAGFNLYNVTNGYHTTELAGWLSRWLKAQDFHQIHDQVSWELDPQPARWGAFWIGFVLLGLPCNGMLVALTVLSGDWWGFANAMSMIISVLVKNVLVSQNRAAIDQTIKEVEQKCNQQLKGYNEVLAKSNTTTQDKPLVRPKTLLEKSKMIVVMNDSKVITMYAPELLIAPVLASTPRIPNLRLYTLFRWIGWAAFAVHIVSLGMSALPAQLYTVFLLVLSSVLTASKFGCGDSKIWTNMKSAWEQVTGQNKDSDAEDDSVDGISCWVSSNLRAVCSRYPIEYEDWNPKKHPNENTEANDPTETPTLKGNTQTIQRSVWRRGQSNIDEEANPRKWHICNARERIRTRRTERRQDLYVWLDLTDSELTTMKLWNLFPHDNEPNRGWWDEYKAKKELHRRRLHQLKLQTGAGSDAEAEKTHRPDQGV
jgi:hypothetical protein